MIIKGGRYDAAPPVGPPGGGGPYPAAVISAGAQVAWDVQFTTGYRAANLTKTIAANGVPAGWTTETLAGGAIRLVSTAPSALLEGYDLTASGYGVNVMHSNCIVRDNKFNLAVWGRLPGFNAVVNIGGGAALTTTTIEFNDINGGSTSASPAARLTQAAIYEHASGLTVNSTIRGNWIRGCGGDGVDLCGGGALIEQNRIMIQGWDTVAGAHCDLIQWGPSFVSTVASGVAPGIIQDNFFDFTPDPNFTWGRTSCMSLNSAYGTTIRRNVVGFGARVADNSGIGRSTIFYPSQALNQGCLIDNNVWDYVANTTGPAAGVGAFGIESWTQNFKLDTGVEIPPQTFLPPSITAAAHNCIYAYSFKWTGANGATITVSGGQYRKNGGSLVSTPGTVNKGDIVDLRLVGPTALLGNASMSVTVGGFTKTFSVTAGNAAQSLLWFLGPHNTLAQESALAGDWATHKNLMDANRPDNIRWLQMGAQYDPATILYIRAAREVAGSAGANDDKADGDAYMDAPNYTGPSPGTSVDTSGYVIDNPDLNAGSDNHETSKDPAAYYLMNGTHLDWARAAVNTAEWQYEEAGGPHTGYNPAATDWSQRWMAKMFGACVVGKWVGADVGGPIGVVIGDYTGGVSQLAADYLTQILANQDSRGAWPMAHGGTTMTKPWQDALIVNNLILYHKNFDPLNDALKAAILKTAEWLWCCFSQYSDMTVPTFSTTSGKYAAIYMDQYWSDPNSGGAPDGLNGLPDINMFYMFPFAYALKLTGDIVWKNRMLGVLKGAVNDAWYVGGPKWWTELSLGSMGAWYYSNNSTGGLTGVQAPLTPYPLLPGMVGGASPVGSVTGGVYTITSDGAWQVNYAPAVTSTQYEIWHWKKQATAGAIFHRIAVTASVSVAGATGDLVKGRVRKLNSVGPSPWIDTAWTVVP